MFNSVIGASLQASSVVNQLTLRVDTQTCHQVCEVLDRARWDALRFLLDILEMESIPLAEACALLCEMNWHDEFI